MVLMALTFEKSTNYITMNSIRYISLFILLISGFLISSCNSSPRAKDEHGHSTQDKHDDEALEGMVVLNKKQRSALNLQLGVIQERTMAGFIKTNGQLEVSPADKAEITAFMGGNVKSISVFEGDKVRKGQILATLEHPDYISLQQEYIESFNNFTFLAKEYERQKALYDNNVGSGKNFQKVEADYNAAKSSYEGLGIRLQMLNLNTATIKKGTISQSVNILSPVEGYVSQVDISIGAYVDAQTKLFSVVNNDKIHADLLVYEKDMPHVQVGQKARLRIANQDEEHPATIFAIAKKFQKDIKAIVVHANFDDSPGNLIAESYVSGEIFNDKELMKAVPESAIVEDEGKSYIFIVNPMATNEAAHHDEHEDHGHDETDDDHHQNDGHDDGNHTADHTGDNIAFRMVEVIPGLIDNGYVAITIPQVISDDAQVVMAGAFYLLSDLKKSEAEHSH